MKKYANLKCIEHYFKEREWVYLRLQPYTLGCDTTWHRNLKLSPRFYGPFQILQKVGTVAYRLDLPVGSLIHHFFMFLS